MASAEDRQPLAEGRASGGIGTTRRDRGAIASAGAPVDGAGTGFAVTGGAARFGRAFSAGLRSVVARDSGTGCRSVVAGTGSTGSVRAGTGRAAGSVAAGSGAGVTAGSALGRAGDSAGLVGRAVGLAGLAVGLVVGRAEGLAGLAVGLAGLVGRAVGLAGLVGRAVGLAGLAVVLVGLGFAEGGAGFPGRFPVSRTGRACCRDQDVSTVPSLWGTVTGRPRRFRWEWEPALRSRWGWVTPLSPVRRTGRSSGAGSGISWDHSATEWPSASRDRRMTGWPRASGDRRSDRAGSPVSSPRRFRRILR
nr:hypothetical protein GCM10020093_074510 [Planobispora longispora]